VKSLQAESDELKAIVDKTNTAQSKIDFNKVLEELSSAQVLQVSSKQGAKETCVYQ
jgi:hypothetical protein